MHQEDLSMSDRVKLLQSLSNYILPKTKPIRDEFTLTNLLKVKKKESGAIPRSYKVAATFIKASA